MVQARVFPRASIRRIIVTMKRSPARHWQVRAVALGWGACAHQALLDRFLDFSEEMSAPFRHR